MNILLLIPGFGPGGAERSLARLSKYLASDHQVYACCFSRRSGPEHLPEGTLLDLKVEGTPWYPLKAYRFVRRVQKVASIKRELGIDVCISFLEGANYLNVLSKGSDGVIISSRGSVLHDVNITGVLGWIRRRVLIPLLYPRADVVVAPSAGIRSELIHHFRVADERALSIPNFYDVEEIARLSREEVDPSFARLFDGPSILTVARLHPQKGIGDVLVAFSEVHRRNPRVRLVVIGDGPLRTSLVNDSRSGGFKTFASWEGQKLGDESVAFLGYQQNPYPYLRRASAFVLGSKFEGFPNVVVEAMACGTPVAVADSDSGPREILTGESNHPGCSDAPLRAPYGILLPSSPIGGNQPRIRAWGSELLSLVEDESLRATYSDASLRRSTDFSPRRVTRLWDEVIERNSAGRRLLEVSRSQQGARTK